MEDIIRSSSSHHSCIYQLCNLGKSFPFLGFITIKMNMSTPMDFQSAQLTCTSRTWNVGVGKFLLMLPPSCSKTGIFSFLWFCVLFFCATHISFWLQNLQGREFDSFYKQLPPSLQFLCKHLWRNNNNNNKTHQPISLLPRFLFRFLSQET